MPSDLAMKAMNGAHRAVLWASRGRLGWTAGGMPVLELTTVGRRTGERRSVMLTSPIQLDGDVPVVVASRGGDDSHPAWFLNLRDQPQVEVAWKGAPAGARVARIPGDEERGELWAAIVAEHAHYGGYQRKTDRQIPLVVLEAAPD